MRHLLILAALTSAMLTACCSRHACPPCAACPDAGAPLPVPACASKDGGCDAGP